MRDNELDIAFIIFGPGLEFQLAQGVCTDFRAEHILSLPNITGCDLGRPEWQGPNNYTLQTFPYYSGGFLCSKPCDGEKLLFEFVAELTSLSPYSRHSFILVPLCQESKFGMKGSFKRSLPPSAIFLIFQKKRLTKTN